MNNSFVSVVHFDWGSCALGVGIGVLAVIGEQWIHAILNHSQIWSAFYSPASDWCARISCVHHRPYIDLSTECGPRAYPVCLFQQGNRRKKNPVCGHAFPIAGVLCADIVVLLIHIFYFAPVGAMQVCVCTYLLPSCIRPSLKSCHCGRHKWLQPLNCRCLVYRLVCRRVPHK